MARSQYHTQAKETFPLAPAGNGFRLESGSGCWGTWQAKRWGNSFLLENIMSKRLAWGGASSQGLSSWVICGIINNMNKEAESVNGGGQEGVSLNSRCSWGTSRCEEKAGQSCEGLGHLG